MKIRSGFVSNSSSASFIIHFSSTLPQIQIESIIRKCEDYIDKKWDEDQTHIHESWSSIFARKKDPSLAPEMDEHTYPAYKHHLEFKEDHYELNQETTMFNDWYDINCWKFIRALSEQRIKDTKLIKIHQTEEEYADCDKDVDFDVSPWDSEYDDADKEKAINYNLDYLVYLKESGQAVSSEEEVEIARKMLSE